MPCYYYHFNTMAFTLTAYLLHLNRYYYYYIITIIKAYTDQQCWRFDYLKQIHNKHSYKIRVSASTVSQTFDNRELIVSAVIISYFPILWLLLLYLISQTYAQNNVSQWTVHCAHYHCKFIEWRINIIIVDFALLSVINYDVSFNLNNWL